MKNKLIFTKEIKNTWLNALKSGKYIQGVGELMNTKDGVKRHCCLGVLCEVHPRLGLHIENGTSFTETLDGEIQNRKGESWFGIKKVLGITGDQFNVLWKTNDYKCDGEYSAVIPLIEQIPTKD